jgi:5-methylcytosine-specific restriction endonuclease McrA
MLTLTVDSSAKPIDLIPVRSAVSHLAGDMLSDGPNRFQVLAEDPARRFRSQSLDIAAPLVVLFPGYIELDSLQANRVTRRVLFARDRWQCQYCGWVAPGSSELTVDHVKPVHLFARKSEANTWENCVAACRQCNVRKGGMLPRECGMMPLRTPRQPHYVQLRFGGKLHGVQRDYIRDYFGQDALDDF